MAKDIRVNANSLRQTEALDAVEQTAGLGIHRGGRGRETTGKFGRLVHKRLRFAAGPLNLVHLDGLGCRLR